MNDFPQWLRTVFVVLLCLWMWSVAAAQTEPRPLVLAAPLERCLNLDATDLRGELRTVTRQFFDAELGAVDVPRMVENKWLELGMPNLLAAEVARATESVRAETGFGRRLTSSFSPAQATELAEQIAGRAFASEAFRSRLETLASEVATDFTGSFDSVAARSATSATQCVQRFLGNTYGDTLAGAFEQAVRAQVEATPLDPITGEVQPERPFGLRSGVGAATIAGGYVARAVAQRLSVQLSRRIAGNITARVLGRAGSSVIPVIGWAIGGGLIVWDVGSSALRGPFPAIRRQLAGDETQAQIQQEIVTSLKQDLPTLSAELSTGIANEIFTQWQAFTQNFALVLNLAEHNATFRQELETIPESDLYKLAEIANLVPERAMLRAAQSGELRRVVQLPESALEILQTNPSLSTVLAWSDVAGTRLDEVIGAEVYRHKTPADFSQARLARLLDTGSVITIAALTTLPTAEMNALLDVSTSNLNALAQAFSAGELQTVAWYADALTPDAFSALLVRLLERPTRLDKFAPPGVRTAVAESREPLAAVALVGSEPSGLLSLTTELPSDLAPIISGSVSGRLLFAKYNLAALLGVLVAALLIVWALLSLLTRPLRRRSRHRA